MATRDSDRGESDHAFVYCASCGARAPTSWSFCRGCDASLVDARSPDEGPPDLPEEPAPTLDDGCPKCNCEEAEIDSIATTGTGLSKLFNIQTRQYKVVTCTNCGYSELYRGQDAGVMLDLFVG